MRKFVCLLLVAVLALSLSAAVFARDERCPCGGKYEWGSTETNGTHTCKTTPKSHPCTIVKTGWLCTSCNKFTKSNPTVKYLCASCECSSCGG